MEEKYIHLISMMWNILSLNTFQKMIRSEFKVKFQVWVMIWKLTHLRKKSSQIHVLQMMLQKIVIPEDSH
jgi:hypothetical protein